MYIGFLFFNINNLYNRNIDAVERSRVFNSRIHLVLLSFNVMLYMAF